MQKITPMLWFDTQAEEAARFYTSIFDDSKIKNVTHYGDAGAEEGAGDLALGAAGVVSVVGHVAGEQYAAMVDAVDRGDLAEARRIHASLIPVVDALMTTSQGAIMAKAALVELGVIESAAVRLPLVESPPEHLELLRSALATLPTR